LQPIVENAIEHGILPFNKDGKITISVRERQYSLEIFVEDNGIGMDEDMVEMFNKEMNLYYSKYPQSIGLRNVNQRVKLLYGEEYGITIQKAHPNGTVVKIEIPKNK
jgi:two-component system sensor histidine kinase YesM